MSPSDELLNIHTPENVAFGYRVVGIGSRFLAALIDSLLILLLQAIVGVTTVLVISTLAYTFDAGSSETLGLWTLAITTLIAFGLFWGYYIFFEMLWNGQSPGKRWVGLRVIRNDGTPITLIESIIRNLVRLVDFLPLYYGLGVVTMFIDSQSRRLGDLAAGTLVVQERAALSLASLASKPVSTSAVTSESAPVQPGGLPAERLSREDLRMAEDFLRRRDNLTNRAALAQRLAQVLAERMQLPAQSLTGAEAEQLIANVVQASRGQGHSNND